MKILLLVSSLFLATVSFSQNFEFLQLTAVESVVPGGLGRSRLITINTDGSMQEVKLQNFYSMAGINFGNIRENDKITTEKIAELVNQGWELLHVTAAVESSGNNAGLFITRYLFKKEKT